MLSRLLTAMLPAQVVELSVRTADPLVLASTISAPVLLVAQSTPCNGPRKSWTLG